MFPARSLSRSGFEDAAISGATSDVVEKAPPGVRVCVRIAPGEATTEYANTAFPWPSIATSGLPTKPSVAATRAGAANPPASVQRAVSTRPLATDQTTAPVPSSPTVALGANSSSADPSSDTCSRGPKSSPAGRAAASITRWPPGVWRCQATIAVPAAFTAITGNSDSSASFERSFGTLKLPFAARVVSWILGSFDFADFCCQTTVALPVPSTATRGKDASGAEMSSGFENEPPGGRTDATTTGRPASLRVHTASTVPSGAAATSTPATASAGPGSVAGLIQLVAPAVDGRTISNATTARSAASGDLVSMRRTVIPAAARSHGVSPHAPRGVPTRWVSATRR